MISRCRTGNSLVDSISFERTPTNGAMTWLHSQKGSLTIGGAQVRPGANEFKRAASDMGVRKDYRNLSVAEGARFIEALKHVKSRGVVDDFARVHERHFNMGIHRSSHFLPWHREFLLRFEQELKQFDARVDIPYWDSSVDRSTSASLWDNDFLGQFNAAWRLNRALGSATLPSPQAVQNNQQRSSYATFWDELEVSIHNPPHRWVGGAMAQADSPRDPVFYLPHAWIDLLWATWQAAHPNTPFVASGPGLRLNSPLMEWPNRTPADVIDHHALGYAYDIEPVPGGPVASGDDMQPDEVLGAGQAISSANGRFTFVYEGDGNLVLYGPGGALWASNTNGQPVGGAIMQGDGNLVIYGPGSLYVWDSATDGNPGSRLVVQDDGTVVIYRPDGTPAWATNTVTPGEPVASGDDMQPGEVLGAGQAISSANGRFTFVYQGDGNLVLYGPGGALWASNTNGQPVGGAIMQGDGNLVIYGPGSLYVWDSATDGNPGSRLVVQDDGTVVIYRPDGTPAWATNTVTP